MRKSLSLTTRYKHKITSTDIALFSRQLATMLKVGIPIVQALTILAYGQTNLALKKLLQQLTLCLESGTAFSSALQQYPHYFNTLYCNLVAVGEQSGTLDSMLERIATHKEKIESIKDKIKKALIYPITVVSVSCVITAILLIFVVPKFESVFSTFGAELPLPTQLVMHISHLLLTYGGWISAAIAGVVISLLRLHKRSAKTKRKTDALLLKLPIVGIILHKAAIARFARTLSTTFAAGLPLIDALHIVAAAAGNRIYTRAILHMRSEIAAGQTIHQAMKKTTVFPHMVVQMVAVGETTGALESMLQKVAEFYEEQVNNAVNGLNSLLEPAIMLILGIVIGGLVIAMYLPIFRLGAVIGS